MNMTYIEQRTFLNLNYHQFTPRLSNYNILVLTIKNKQYESIINIYIVLFSLQSKADNGLTEIRIDSIVYVGHVEIVDNTIYIEPVNIIKVEANNVSTIYVNGSATTLKYVVVEPKIKVDIIKIKFNK